MRLLDDKHYTHAFSFPQVHKREVGNRLIFKCYETVKTGIHSKGPYYTVREVAELLGKSCSAIYAYVRKGKIRAYQNYQCGHIRISQEFLDEFRTLSKGAA